MGPGDAAAVQALGHLVILVVLGAGAFIAILFGAIGFMVRHYFLRVERRLQEIHDIRNIQNTHGGRLGLLERRVFGHAFEDDGYEKAVLGGGE